MSRSLSCSHIHKLQAHPPWKSSWQYINTEKVTQIKFNSSGSFALISFWIGRIELWDFRSTPVAMAALLLPNFHTDETKSKAESHFLAWSDDDTHVAAGCKQDRAGKIIVTNFFLWNVATQSIVGAYR